MQDNYFQLAAITTSSVPEVFWGVGRPMDCHSTLPGHKLKLRVQTGSDFHSHPKCLMRCGEDHECSAGLLRTPHRNRKWFWLCPVSTLRFRKSSVDGVNKPLMWGPQIIRSNWSRSRESGLYADVTKQAFIACEDNIGPWWNRLLIDQEPLVSDRPPLFIHLGV